MSLKSMISRRMLSFSGMGPRMTPVSRKKVEFIDITLRDGQQSLLATRMSTPQILKMLPLILDTGVNTLEVWGGATLDSAMRYLNENPFERLSSMASVAAPYGASLRALSRGQNLFGYDPYPDDIVRDFNREAVEAGVSIMRIFDALNYTPNLLAALEGVREADGLFDAAICYTTGAPYDIDHFVSKAMELEAMGADMISDKDMAGLKDPLSAWEYYTALKKNLSVPLVSHTHCTPGFGHMSAVIALLAGVDRIDTCFLPLSGGSSHPSIEVLSLFAELVGVETGLDLSPARTEIINEMLLRIIEEVEEKFSMKVHRAVWPGRDALIPVAEKILDRLSKGRIRDALESMHKLEHMCGLPAPNREVLEAQIPGGMYSNFISQLAKDGKSEYLERALDAVQNVRKKAGWCPLVTPTSQIIGVKAYFNALGKDVNPVQYFNLIAGYYGKTPFRIDPDYRESVCGFREEREYDSSDFNRDIPLLGDTGIPLAETPHEKLLYYLFPDSSGKAYLEKLRFAELEDRMKQEEKAREKKRQAEIRRLQDEAILNRFSGRMDELSERLSEAVSGTFRERETSNPDQSDGIVPKKDNKTPDEII